MSDPRFARLHTDPRFVRPKASRNKFVVDDRFKQLFEEGAAGGKRSKRERKVDKYGRPLEKDSSVNDLKRYYRLASPSAEAEQQVGSGDASSAEEEDEVAEGLDTSGESSEDDDDADKEPAAGPSEGKSLVDYARGAVLLESSDEEELESDDESVSSSAEGSVTLGGRSARRRASRSPSIDLSETEPSAFPNEEDALPSEEEEEEDVDPTKRVALVNLDWDHLRASDLYRVLASSLTGTTGPVPPPKPNKGKKAANDDDVEDIKLSAKLSIAPGRLLNLRIYPSQFGRERMEREAIEGPPAEVLRAKGADSSGDENDDDKTLKLGRKSKSREKARRRKLGGMSDDEEENLTAQDLVDEQVREGEEDYDTEALRKYQLERLRYYFAIATFDSAATAAHVVGQINGTEFERTANVFDMQYVPDDTSFDEDPVHDEATEASIAAEGNSYQGLDFQTDALRHSKVKLTWDADDPHRKTKIQTYLAGVLDKSKQKGATKGRPKITEDDVAQYLASSSDEDEDAEAEEEADDFFEPAEAAPATGEKPSKKLSKRDRLRGLLGLTSGAGAGGGDAEMEMAWDGEAAGGKKARKAAAEGDMQITFAPALSERSAKQLDFAGDERPETSIERYKRKEKERKERKKAERKARLEGRLDENGEPLTPSADALAAQGDDAGFDDDFFADDGEDPFATYDNGGADSGDEIGLPKQGKKAAAKLSKQERRAQREAEEKAAAEEEAKLGLLIGSDDEQDMFGADAAGEGGRHFDMRAVLKAEKNQGKKRKLKGKKAKAAKEQEVVQDNFKIDTTDDRFKSLHSDFDFAIDPSNPRYQKSRNMEALLAEGRKRRAEKNNKLREPVTASEDRPVRKRALPADTGDSLDKLVEAVKRKAGEAGGRGKRTKVDG